MYITPLLFIASKSTRFHICILYCFDMLSFRCNQIPSERDPTFDIEFILLYDQIKAISKLNLLA